MTLYQSLFVIGLLIAASAFFSVSEISLAASRRLRLRQMADDGDARAERVLRVQEQPGDYFTVVQIGQNAVAILGGIVGEGALSPHFSAFFELWLEAPTAQTLGFLGSFLIVTSLFILFSDLFPKRLGMATPELLAIRVSRPMAVCMTLLRPLVWFYSRWADALFRLFGLSSLRDDRITSDDILSMMEAGAVAGVLAARELQVITNVFELDTRTVGSAMSPRDRIAFFYAMTWIPSFACALRPSRFQPTRCARAILTMWSAMWTPRTCSSACSTVSPFHWLTIAWCARC